jgi:predicted nucleotidyltransferase
VLKYAQNVIITPFNQADTVRRKMTQPIEKSKLLERVKTAVRTLAPTAEIILYGSRARGTAGVDSDWDFLILLSSPRDKTLEAQIKDRLYDVELETDTILSSVIRSKKEWWSAQYAVLPFRQQVEKDGVPL